MRVPGPWPFKGLAASQLNDTSKFNPPGPVCRGAETAQSVY